MKSYATLSHILSKLDPALRKIFDNGNMIYGNGNVCYGDDVYLQPSKSVLVLYNKQHVKYVVCDGVIYDMNEQVCFSYSEPICIKNGAVYFTGSGQIYYQFRKSVEPSSSHNKSVSIRFLDSK